jgi:CDP-diacylglycerol--serine O-phosphatidyltransferase
MKVRFKSLVERHQYLKAAPNFLTLCNSLCGFAAILYTLRAYELASADNSLGAGIFAVSAWVILGAMIFDALDGFVARLLNAASMHGVQMDSLADMVTFGVAPATVVAIMTHTLRGTMSRNQEIIVYLLCSVYLGCAAIRLATYNVHAILNKKSSDKFAGLPSPGAAAAICSVVLFAESAKISMSTLAMFLPYYAAFLGLLMVSSIPYTHFGKWLTTLRRNRQRQFAAVVMLVIVLVFKGTGVLLLMTAYVLSGPVGMLLSGLRHKMGGPAAEAGRTN